MSEDVRTDLIDGVAVVVLDRPAKRNALTADMIKALPAVLEDLDARDDVHAIVLTGADPAFCAGLDLGDVASGGLVAAGDGGSGARTRPVPDSMGTPLIGAINGPAVTGGLELALQCDFLLASEFALFADTHARVGIMPRWGLSVDLPQAVGVRRARQMSFTGDYVDAEMALAWGLVNEVVPHDALIERAVTLGHEMAGIDQANIAGMKRMYAQTTAVAPGEGLELEETLSRDWLRTSFDREAVERNRRQIQARGSKQV